MEFQSELKTQAIQAVNKEVNQQTDNRTHYRTIVLSDIHLGSKWSKTREVNQFLAAHSCDTLILVGDIIDGWSIMRGKKGKWRRRHTRFIKLLLDMQHDTKIIYLRGNHDDFLDRIAPLTFGNIEICKNYTYTGATGRRYFVLHGDIFDKVTSRFSWLAKLGDVGYSTLLLASKLYNRRRVKKGLPYYSLAKEIKQKIKVSVSYISDYEDHIAEIAQHKKCDGVICGHIHHPEIKDIQGIEYLNSGDWIESLSALSEDENGKWNIIFYNQWQTEQATTHVKVAQ